MNWWIEIGGPLGLSIKMKKTPNKFHRFMMTLCFGVTWVYK